MSTFSGKIAEIPEISVDNFENDNKTSLVYFLSHCHSDHMKGLGDVAFQTSLVQRPNVYLYASPISIKILKNMYKDKHRYAAIEEKLKEIPIHESTLIKIPNGQYFTVSAMPAGHCPGSVMFLFETNDKNILYTGDYRVSSDDLEKYKAFYSLGKLKKIDKMYLDTTFFKTSYPKFPPREESLKNVCSFIKEWIQLSPNHLVNIVPSANYGFEFLYMEIANEMQMPIHVSENCFNVYECIPEMDSAITLNADQTQLHSNCGYKFKETCLNNTELVRKIMPSALWWDNKNVDDCLKVDGNENLIRICYSSHASFEEIKDFLLFLKPIEVEPCVVPLKKDEMMNLLEQIMSSYTVERSETESVKLFDCVEEDELRNNVQEENTLEDLLRSPPKSFSRKRRFVEEV